MAIQQINIGGYANDGTGDDLRTAFEKVNANFAELGGTSGITSGTNLGDGVEIFAQRNSTSPSLEFKTLTSLDGSVEITPSVNGETVDLKNNSTLANDPAPMLGANLNLNGYYVYGGDTQTTVFGIDLRATNALLELLLASNSVTINFGTFLEPTGTSGMPGDTGIELDMNGLLLNGFAGTPQVGNINFGTFV